MKTVLVATLALMVVGCGGSGASASPATVSSAPATAAAAVTPFGGGAIRPAPQPTPEPTPEPDPRAFDDIVRSGRGSKIVKFTIPSGAIGVATITHRGSSNFIVEVFDSGGSTLDLLVNEIGNYSGTRLLLIEGEQPAGFKIDADGSWKITIKGAIRAPIWDRSTTLKGKGDAVYLISPPASGLVIIRLSYRGDSNFIVHAYGDNGSEGLANEIGNYSGETLLPEGAVILEVIAHGGTWTAATE